MVEPIFHDLLKGKSHKTIFNEIYRFYLKNNTNDEIINLSIEIHNYINSCVNFINYEIKCETKIYFQKFKNNSCFSYEKKIKTYLSSIRL